MLIQSINLYTSPAAVLKDWAPGTYDSLTGSEREFLYDCVDYENVCYYVLNEHHVLTVDSISGDVLGEDALCQFETEAVEFAKENAKGE